MQVNFVMTLHFRSVDYAYRKPANHQPSGPCQIRDRSSWPFQGKSWRTPALFPPDSPGTPYLIRHLAETMYTHWFSCCSLRYCNRTGGKNAEHQRKNNVWYYTCRVSSIRQE